MNRTQSLYLTTYLSEKTMQPDFIDVVPEKSLEPCDGETVVMAFVIGYDDGSWLSIDYAGDWWTSVGPNPTVWKEIDPERIPSYTKEFWYLVQNHLKGWYFMH